VLVRTSSVDLNQVRSEALSLQAIGKGCDTPHTNPNL